jgi:hypothetical protein
MKYVTKKATNGKHVFSAHILLSAFVLGKYITLYVTLKNVYCERY